MVLIRGKRAGLAAALDGLQGGLQAGFGMGQQMRRTQLAEREQQAQEERYKQSVALASQAAALDAQREKRYADEATRNNQLQDEQRAGARALIDSRIEGITPEQTAPGAPPIDGIGPKSLSKFGAGLMQHHARVLDHAKAASKNIPPEFLDRFWGDVSSGLQNDQQKAQIAKFQSDLEGFGNDANTELGGGPIQDLMGEAGDGQAKKGSGALGRFGELKGILDSIAGQDPMLAATPEERQKQLAERQKMLQVVAQGIGQTHDQLNREELRRKTVAATIAEYEPKLQMERAAAATFSGPLRAIIEARVNAKELALIQYKRDRDFDLQKALSDADDITLPTGRGGAGGGEGGGPGATDTKSLDRDAAIRARAAERADKAFEAQSKLKDDDPNKLPWQSLFAREYQMLGGKGDKAPEAGDAGANDPMSPFRNHAPGAAPIDRATEKAVFDPTNWQAKVQELVDSGQGKAARELFMKARGEIVGGKIKGDETDGIPADGKKLMRARR